MVAVVVLPAGYVPGTIIARHHHRSPLAVGQSP